MQSVQFAQDREEATSAAMAQIVQLEEQLQRTRAEARDAQAQLAASRQELVIAKRSPCMLHKQASEMTTTVSLRCHDR